ncbi:MAG TPA: CS1-pili formation C-terminal domain-containing protein, partial [Gammaproteobacteria bacterium]
DRRGAINTDLEVSRTGSDWLAFLSFSYRFNGDGHSMDLATRMEYEAIDGGYERTDFGANFQSRWMAGAFDQHQLAIRADNMNQRSLEASVETSGRSGAAELALRRNFDAGVVEFDGLLSSSVAFNSRGATIGDSRSAESAFMIRVDGVDDGSLFEVLLDGSPRLQVGAGHTYLLPAAPYATYEIELRPLGQELIEIDRVKYVKTVYPGNVIDLQWSARLFRVVFGQLVDRDGRPLGNAVIGNVQGIAATDQHGYFQAEVDQFTEQLNARKGDQRCTARFEAPPTGAGQVVGLGTLVCGD